MKKLYLALISLIVLTGFNRLFAQAPNISYTTPQVYTVNTAIAPLSPANTGGAVPPTVYGKTTTIAGNGSANFANGTGAAASFNKPYTLRMDGSGNILVADTYNQMIRKVTTGGVVSTFAGNGTIGSNNGTLTTSSFNNPGNLAFDASGNIYITDQANYLIRKIDLSGNVSTYAGNGVSGSNNGSALLASFVGPSGVVLDKLGNLYVADKAGYTVREITSAGVVSTFAGTGSPAFANSTGTAASFNYPANLAFDATGNLYVCDQFNDRIRKITTAGVVSTYAGSGVQGSSNGTLTTASFYQPFDIAIDPAGNMFVADEFNQTIREITPAGVVNTLAGATGVVGASDGVGSTASFNYPTGVAPDGLGNVYVCETGGNKVRKVVATGYTIDKNLPAGLSFNVTTGIITGTPTASSPATVYTITAYNTSGSSITTVSITVLIPVTQTITFPSITTKTYGAADFSPGATASSGLPVTYTSSNPAVATISSSGNIHIIGAGTSTITALQAGGLSSDNTISYKAAAPAMQTLTVNQTPLTITADNKTRLYGSANPTLTVTCNGFVYNETATVLTTQPTVATTANAASPVNIYQITPSGAVAANYTISYVIGQLAITPATLTITADDKTKVQGTVNPDLTITYTGFLNGDDVKTLSNLPYVQTIATTTSPIGTYPITVTGAVNTNYIMVYVPGTLTILSPQTITFPTIAVKTYGDADFTVPATASSGLPVTYTSNNPAVAAITVSGTIHITGAGKSIIIASQTGNSSYGTATPVMQTLIVNPASLTIAADNQSRVYSAANPTFTVSYTGFVYGETSAVLSTQPTITTTAITTSNTGTYPITANGAADANYNIIYMPGTLTINQATQTINFPAIPDQTKGDPDITLTVLASSGLPVTLSSSNPLVAPVNGLTVKLLDAGTVTITGTQAGDNNYLPATATQTLTINSITLPNMVVIHPLVTPNGDGINDVLLIEGIDKYPDNKLTLVNKNGVKVYEATGYDNANNCFNGYSSITKTPQPQGTYFYSLQFTANGKTEKRVGYIVLKY